MARKIFVNLPVKNLDKSKAFYEALGFTINPNFTDETAACVVISDDIYVMILTHAKFGDFTSKAIADSAKTTEVLTALSCESKADVDKIAGAALEAGGTENKPVNDMGFMYIHSVADLDGHIWEFFWMDPAAVPA
jgi:predicted lactoylglutathione lyase